MQQFKEFFHLSESVNGFRYKIPASKPQLMFDFYTLVSLPVWGLTPNKTNAENLSYIVKECQDQIVDYLKPHLLECVHFAIASEFRHIIRWADEPYEDVRRWFEKNGKSKLYDDLFSLQGLDVPKNDILRVIDKHFTPTAFVDFAMRSFAEINWSGNYGGSAWYIIARAWQRLYDAKKYDDKVIAIDHVFDIQHNTDTVLNKISAYADKMHSYSWIGYALNKKKHASNLYDFINDISPELKYFVMRVIKAGTGETFESYLKKTHINPYALGKYDHQFATGEENADRSWASVVTYN